MSLKPKCHRKRLAIRDLLYKYQSWYTPKFYGEAPLSSEINIRGFGHVKYFKAIVVLYSIFNYNYDDMINYANFVFKSWSATSGNGASIKYFPNWLISNNMISQYRDSAKTLMIKKTTEEHATYSDHSQIGQSHDTTFKIGVIIGEK